MYTHANQQNFYTNIYIMQDIIRVTLHAKAFIIFLMHIYVNNKTKSPCNLQIFLARRSKSHFGYTNTNSH